LGEELTRLGLSAVGEHLLHNEARICREQFLGESTGVLLTGSA